mmetsp:Transcript_5395/g.18102  ORF Transcript_5395/g.18102 Transcript_5395/m.18102 type:complete len:737 (-) Transcript_5395:157-2367(-)
MGRDSTGFGARFIFRLELPARARTLVRCLHPQRPPEALPPRRVRKGSAPARPPQRRPRERRRVHAAGTAGFLVGTPPCAAMMGLKNMAKSAGQLASSTASGLASRAGDIAAKSGVTDMAKSAAQSAGGMVSKGASAVGTAAGTALSPLKSMASGPEVVRDPVEDAADIAAIEAAYKKAEEGMRLFISGELEAMEKFFAEQTVHDKPGEPPVFHHCHAMIMSIKALVTGDDGDIKAALELINRVVGMCQECFPKRGYVKGALDWGKSWFKVSVVSPKELGARLIVAEECYLAGGLHMFEESMSSFFKGVLSFHRAVAGYRHCTAVYDLPGQPAAVHDKGAIAGGMAATQLAMSLIPARMLAMIKLLGFKVDRAAALQKLADASLEGGPRAPVFACIRILYHVLIPSLFSLPAERRTHAEEAQASFDFLKDEWPGHLHSYLLGRQLRLNGDVAGAIMQFRQVASIQSTDPGWQRLQITWQYELALSHMHQLSWEESERHWGLLASGLFKESWSPGLFHYNRGVCLVMMGQLADAAGEFGEAEAVIRAKRKFIGRTPSEDQYVLRKVRRPSGPLRTSSSAAPPRRTSTCCGRCVTTSWAARRASAPSGPSPSPWRAKCSSSGTPSGPWRGGTSRCCAGTRTGAAWRPSGRRRKRRRRPVARAAAAAGTAGPWGTWRRFAASSRPPRRWRWASLPRRTCRWRRRKCLRGSFGRSIGWCPISPTCARSPSSGTASPRSPRA